MTWVKWNYLKLFALYILYILPIYPNNIQFYKKINKIQTNIHKKKQSLQLIDIPYDLNLLANQFRQQFFFDLLDFNDFGSQSSQFLDLLVSFTFELFDLSAVVVDLSLEGLDVLFYVVELTHKILVGFFACFKL